MSDNDEAEAEEPEEPAVELGEGPWRASRSRPRRVPTHVAREAQRPARSGGRRDDPHAGGRPRTRRRARGVVGPAVREPERVRGRGRGARRARSGRDRVTVPVRFRSALRRLFRPLRFDSLALRLSAVASFCPGDANPKYVDPVRSARSRPRGVRRDADDARNRSHESAIERVRKVCLDAGFGIPVEFSPSEMLNEKVDADPDRPLLRPRRL